MMISIASRKDECGAPTSRGASSLDACLPTNFTLKPPAQNKRRPKYEKRWLSVRRHPASGRELSSSELTPVVPTLANSHASARTRMTRAVRGSTKTVPSTVFARSEKVRLNSSVNGSARLDSSKEEELEGEGEELAEVAETPAMTEEDSSVGEEGIGVLTKRTPALTPVLVFCLLLRPSPW